MAPRKKLISVNDINVIGKYILKNGLHGASQGEQDAFLRFVTKMEAPFQETIVYKSHGPRKISVIKAIRELRGYSLKEGKDWCEKVWKDADDFKLTRKEADALMAAGAEVDFN